MGTINVAGLGKAYKQYPTRWSRLVEWFFPFAGIKHNLKWVLREINFHISPGEAVGILGVNGAGKSTLLKLITGTAQATTGSVSTRGRVAALLELGMGFHPDFTGRQNVLMAGQLIGLSADEIASLMPEIEAFAEIGDYIDSPVRVYSSGMQMRLAFSVATCVRPDILIVDEALAVGDVFFQQKCFERISGFTSSGTTLLFVSHSTGTVLNICSRAILLKQGAVAYDGLPKDAIDLYQADLLLRLDSAPEQIKIKTDPVAEVCDDAQPVNISFATVDEVLGKSGSITTDAAHCLAVRFVGSDGKDVNTVLADQPVTLQISYGINRSISDPHVGFKIRNRFGIVLFETNTYCMGQSLGAVNAKTTLSVQFEFSLNLFPDDYTITVGLADGGYGEASFREVLSYLHEVTTFVVLPNSESIIWAGLINLHPQLEFTKY